jgi:hypothetical protein
MVILGYHLGERVFTHSQISDSQIFRETRSLRGSEKKAVECGLGGFLEVGTYEMGRSEGAGWRRIRSGARSRAREHENGRPGRRGECVSKPERPGRKGRAERLAAPLTEANRKTFPLGPKFVVRTTATSNFESKRTWEGFQIFPLQYRSRGGSRVACGNSTACSGRGSESGILVGVQRWGEVHAGPSSGVRA